MGSRVAQFERLFAEFCGVRHAVATNNGTAALHLALVAAGVGRGDEVLVPDLTYVATANAVTYCGAVPIACDVEPDSWCISPLEVERLITFRTKAVIAVHLYGHPCQMTALREICRSRGVALVEDAAEAHGAEVAGRRVGSLGDVASFSFYGNKMITTGEGGMCTTDSDQTAGTIRLYRGQGVDPRKRYWHSVVGFNYRMSDLQGGVGCAQMERLPGTIEQHCKLADVYRARLRNSGLVLPVERPDTRNVYWLFSVSICDVTYEQRDRVMIELAARGIETRPVFYPLHQLPPYRSLGQDKDFPVSTRLAHGGISLPTHAEMSRQDAECVARALLSIVQ